MSVSAPSTKENILYTQSRISYQFKRYIALTKPRIVMLLSITGIVGFLIASRGNIDFFKLIVAIYMGYGSAGGAMVINSYIDRDIDVVMNRTNKRASVLKDDPIDPPEKILVFGGLMVLSAVLVAGFIFNLLTALFLMWGVLFYLFGYSLYLKRNSLWNNIIGGLASPTPVWVGYAAIQNTAMLTNLEAWLLGFLVFIWTPSHTWALASKYYEDYKKANIPVLPAIYGLKTTSRFTFGWIFIVVLYAIGISYWLTNGNIIVQLLLIIPNIIIIYSGYKFLKNHDTNSAYRCFKTHNIWLAITFIAIWIFLKPI